eukprot:2020248-Amphidinium_carterae.2
MPLSKRTKGGVVSAKKFEDPLCVLALRREHIGNFGDPLKDINARRTRKIIPVGPLDYNELGHIGG